MIKILLLFSFFTFSELVILPFSYAHPKCLNCQEDVVEGQKSIQCPHGHVVHGVCLNEQLQHTPEVSSIQTDRLLCNGRDARNCACTHSFTLEQIQRALEPIQIETLNERLLREGTFDPKLFEKDADHLSKAIDESFVFCCPNEGCGERLDQIEGCNAATCSNKKCKDTFCYLCLEREENSLAAHEHVKGHSGDYWDYRPGYPDRYHWILARKELAQVFKRKVNPALREAALNAKKTLLREKNMWPLPAGKMTLDWLKEVAASIELLPPRGYSHLLMLPEGSPIPAQINPEAIVLQKKENQVIAIWQEGNQRVEKNVDLASTPSLLTRFSSNAQEIRDREFVLQIASQCGLTREKKIELLQNEAIYRRQVKDKKNADLVDAEIRKLGGKVLMSLDIRDTQGVDPQIHREAAQGAQAAPAPHIQAAAPLEGAQQPHPAIIPILDNDPRVAQAPRFFALGREGRTYQVGHLMWSGVVPRRKNQREAERFCQGLGGGSRLPTIDEWRLLGQAMTRDGQYNRNTITDIADRWFWSSSAHPHYVDLAFYYDGSSGSVGVVAVGAGDGSVRCVR